MKFLKKQLTDLSKGAKPGDTVYISPLKVKLQAAVKKGADGKLKVFVLELGGKYESSFLQELEFTISPDERGSDFRAQVESEESSNYASVPAEFFAVSQAVIENLVGAEMAKVLLENGDSGVGTEGWKAATGFSSRLSDDEIKRIAKIIIEELKLNSVGQK